MKISTRAILAGALIVHSSASWAQRPTIYTTTFLPPVELDGESAHIIWLDLPEQMLKNLSRHRWQAQTAPAVLTHIAAREGEGFFETLTTQITGLVAAWSHSIEALPAIVLEDRYVLYGIYSLQHARARVDAHRDKDAQ